MLEKFKHFVYLIERDSILI